MTSSMGSSRLTHDIRIAKAARAFYQSPMWFHLYREGRMPLGVWTEYLDLRNAILERKPTLSAAQPGSWRLKLARWIAGF